MKKLFSLSTKRCILMLILVAHLTGCGGDSSTPSGSQSSKSSSELLTTCTLSPISYGFGASSGTGIVTVTAPSGDYAWTGTSNDSWITITSGSSGTGNGTVSYSVDANATGSGRKGTMTIAGQTFTVRQAASTFFDDPGNMFTPYIYGIATEGITKGCWGNANYYCPDDAVTRGAMAAFIIRALYGEDFSYTQTPYFIDVPAPHGYFKYVQKMRDNGITLGCWGNTSYYCPDDVVTRGAMAAFIIRALYGEVFEYSQTPYFTDVPGVWCGIILPMPMLKQSQNCCQ